ncbi:MAG: hypothetical protein HZA62_12495 [Rhodocyclales bacterium]|nr:hypothetical protein [Rhodocyclales bacterium]
MIRLAYIAFSILLFCVSAMANSDTPNRIVPKPEPTNLIAQPMGKPARTQGAATRLTNESVRKARRNTDKEVRISNKKQKNVSAQPLDQ